MTEHSQKYIGGAEDFHLLAYVHIPNRYLNGNGPKKRKEQENKGMDLRLINPRKYRQLFLDDGAIESQKGTRRTLHPPKKCGPLIKGGYQSRTAP